jgi:hypothetical protein
VLLAAGLFIVTILGVSIRAWIQTGRRGLVTPDLGGAPEAQALFD